MTLASGYVDGVGLQLSLVLAVEVAAITARAVVDTLRRLEMTAQDPVHGPVDRHAAFVVRAHGQFVEVDIGVERADIARRQRTCLGPVAPPRRVVHDGGSSSRRHLLDRLGVAEGDVEEGGGGRRASGPARVGRVRVVLGQEIAVVGAVPEAGRRREPHRRLARVPVRVWDPHRDLPSRLVDGHDRRRPRDGGTVGGTDQVGHLRRTGRMDGQEKIGGGQHVGAIRKGMNNARGAPDRH